VVYIASTAKNSAEGVVRDLWLETRTEGIAQATIFCGKHRSDWNIPTCGSAQLKSRGIQWGRALRPRWPVWAGAHDLDLVVDLKNRPFTEILLRPPINKQKYTIPGPVPNKVKSLGLGL